MESRARNNVENDWELMLNRVSRWLIPLLSSSIYGNLQNKKYHEALKSLTIVLLIVLSACRFFSSFHEVRAIMCISAHASRFWSCFRMLAGEMDTLITTRLPDTCPFWSENNNYKIPFFWQRIVVVLGCDREAVYQPIHQSRIIDVSNI